MANENFTTEDLEIAQQLDAIRTPALLAQERQQAEEEAHQKERKQRQMGWLIFIPSLILSAVADLLEVLTVGTIGWLTGLIIDFLLLVILGFSRAGRKQWKKLVGALFAESIPFVNILPIRTVMLIWSFIASRSKLLSKINQIPKIVSIISSP